MNFKKLSHVFSKGALAAAASLSLFSTGCNPRENPDSGARSDGADSKTLARNRSNIAGVSVFSLGNIFLASEAKLVHGALTEAGWNVRPPIDANSAVDQQVTGIGNLIAAGVTGMVIDPADSAGIVPALNAAEKAGVKVVLVDVGANAGNVYMTVRVDNAAAGAQVAEQIGKLLAESGKSGGTVLELQGMLSQEAGRQRSAGFGDYMAKNHPNVKIIKQPTDWDARKAADATQTVVSSVPIDAIYMHSDCALLPGVLSALKQTGRLFPKGDPKHIVLGSIDGSPLALDNIRSKTLDFIVEQPLLTYAKLSAKYLSDAVQGLPPTEGDDGKGGRVVKGLTGHEHIVKASMVTQENVDDQTLWGNSAK